VHQVSAINSVWDVVNLYGVTVYDPTFYQADFSANYTQGGKAPYFEFSTITITGDASGEPAQVVVGAPSGMVTTYAAGPAVTVSGEVSAITTTAPAGTVSGAVSISPTTPAAITTTAALGEVEGVNIDRSGNTLQLALPSGDEVPRQPGTLYASVSNGQAYGPVYFFHGNETVHFASGYLDALGGQGITLSIDGRSLGYNLLRASQTVSNPQSGGVPFYVRSTQPADSTPSPQAPPPITGVVPVNKWVFQAYDFSSLTSVDTYTFVVNPDSVKQQYGGAIISSEATTVSNGQVIMWEGSAQPVEWTWSGRVLDQAQYLALEAWGTTRQRVYVTDHFRRRFLIKIESVSFQPVRDRTRPWHHTYSMTASVLSGDGISR
jgi:hypothetical protein